MICDYVHIESVPLIGDIEEYAAELRFKYYELGEREFSDADAIHLATATIHDGCHTLYSGIRTSRGLRPLRDSKPSFYEFVV